MPAESAMVKKRKVDAPEESPKAKEKKATQEKIKKNAGVKKITAVNDEQMKNQIKISNFFSVIPKTEAIKASLVGFDEIFPPFFVKPNVHVAPINYFYDQLPLDFELHQSEQVFSFASYYWRQCAPLRHRKSNQSDPSIPLIKMRLHQFYENRRPAYYGSSNVVHVQLRRKFTNLLQQVDYEVDSDDEWESEEEDADSLNSEEDEESEVSASESSEGEDDWLVPHGYLSEDEGVEEAEEEEVEDAKKIKKDKQSNADDYQRKKIADIKPIIMGPFCANLTTMSIQLLSAEVLGIETFSVMEDEKKEKKILFPDEFLIPFLQLVRNRAESVNILFLEFKSK